ncbi:MAG: hypothetical protein HYT70_04240 [Candidatus Aenigmarchaeota archaeon]|nr:hypothetical protein [Candidatus Aenigmarchaeota archaeon]
MHQRLAAWAQDVIPYTIGFLRNRIALVDLKYVERIAGQYYKGEIDRTTAIKRMRFAGVYPTLAAELYLEEASERRR